MTRYRSRSRKLPPGDLSPRNRAMVALLPWKLTKVKDLTLNFKKALATHQKPTKKERKAGLQSPLVSEIEEVMGPNTKIGVVSVPLEVMVVQAMNDPGMRRDYDSFEAYHRDYRKDEVVPRHKHKWPVILSGEGWKSSTIIDGWHRFNSYYRKGTPRVPAMWYADE